MTQFEGEHPKNSPQSHAGSDDSVSSLEPALDPQVEAELREILADLPPVKMPDAIFNRIQSAITAEPHPAAAGPSARNNLHARRNRAFLSIAGVAAAGIIGVYVGSTLMHEAEDTDPALAAVAPMSMSDTVYQGGALANQVAAKMPSWKASSWNATTTASATQSTSIAPTQSAGSDIPTTSASAQASNSASTITAGLRQAITDCIVQIAPIDLHAVVHVEVARYKATSSSPEESVAVAVVKGRPNLNDVYVVPVHCTPPGPSSIREHIQVPGE